MPAASERRERHLIRLFLSAYEDNAWAGCDIKWPEDAEVGGIDALATRMDGQMVAIEHTLIQPFVGEQSDLAEFEKAGFLRIKKDESLIVPNTAIYVYVPVGIVDHKSPAAREKIVNSIHSWIAKNRLKLCDGEQDYSCEIAGMESVNLRVKRTALGNERPKPGRLLIGRQQMKNDLDQVVEKALRTKLPKLVNTQADRHLLFLERDRFNFFPELIFTEIERQRPCFPDLERINEIWHVETIFLSEGYADFDLRKGNELLTTMSFENGVLMGRSENGMPRSV